MTDLNRFYRDVSRAIYDIIKDRGLEDLLTDKGNKEFFAPNLNKISRKELAWLFKRGDIEEITYAITDAFMKIFINRDPFKNFERSGKAPLEQFLHLIFSRQLSKESQSRIKKRYKEVNETSFAEDKDSKFNSLLDSYGTPTFENPEDEAVYEDLLKKLEKKISKKQNFKTLKFIIDSLLSNKSKSEIAKELGVTPVRVSNLLKTIKKILAEVIGSDDKEVAALINTYMK